MLRANGKAAKYPEYKNESPPTYTACPNISSQHLIDADTMTFMTEFNSVFVTPKGPKTSTPPKAGDKAPTTSTLHLESGRKSIVAFLRHCGCPFSERIYLDLQKAASEHPEVNFIAVSHSNDSATNTWLKNVLKDQAGRENVKLVVDEGKEAYAAWGLGNASFMHVANPTSLVAVIKLSASGGISARHTESGSRWQTSGHYAVNENGIVRWGGPAQRADDMINIDEALKALGVSEVKA